MVEPRPVTAREAEVLRRLEIAPAPRHGTYEADCATTLALLERDGLVRRTTEHLVITDAGRVSLVPVDGRTRLTVEPWGHERGGPT